jgi:hypothetical protein
LNISFYSQEQGLGSFDKRTSLYEIERPGNWVERTVDTCSGTGGKDAADTASSKEDRKPKDLQENAMIPQGNKKIDNES